MELSPPLRWLGALAIMLVVVLIAVPLLLQTIGDTVEFGDPAAGASESVVTSEAPTEAVASGGSDDGGEQAGEDDGSGDGDQSGDGGGGDDEFPATYEVVAGDTGSKISEQFYDTRDGWTTIAEANDLDPSAPLRVGVELTIPPPE